MINIKYNDKYKIIIPDIKCPVDRVILDDFECGIGKVYFTLLEYGLYFVWDGELKKNVKVYAIEVLCQSFV